MGDPYWSDEKFVNTTDNVFRNTVDNVFFDSSTPNKSGTTPTIRGGTKVVLPTTGLGIGVVNQDYARKPYLAKSYNEMMRRSTYRGAYNQTLMRQSEFEKPYLEDDYQEMQHFFPIPPLPPWGEWDWIPPEGTTGGPPGGIPGLSGLPGGPKPGISSGFCDITCWDGRAWYGDPCEEALGDCHLAVSTLGIGGTWTVSGPVKEIEYFRDHIQNFPAKDINAARSIYIHADWDNIEKIDDKKEAEFTVTYVDERGNKCKTEVTISCIEKCDCYKMPAFIYDTGNPTSVAPEASVLIRVENGCAPFTWAVAGTGFSFGINPTDGWASPLYADASACGTAIITVTDDCGATVTGYIKSTTGTWNTTPKWEEYKYTGPCDDPAAECSEGVSWNIPTPKTVVSDCNDAVLEENTCCSGANCSGALCTCTVGSGSSDYAYMCGSKYTSCDGYPCKYGTLYWGSRTDIAPDLDVNTECWQCE